MALETLFSVLFSMCRLMVRMKHFVFITVLFINSLIRLITEAFLSYRVNDASLENRGHITVCAVTP